MNDTWESLRISESEDYQEKCKCGDCGKSFDFGSEGDNEQYCLRCVTISAPKYDDY